MFFQNFLFFDLHLKNCNLKSFILKNEFLKSIKNEKSPTY